MVDPDSRSIDYTVDMNVNKQGCHLQISGRDIDPPSVLRERAGKPAHVVVMTPNDVAEIAGTCRDIGVAAPFMDASGEELIAE
jgi:hypothetical protein